jgi:hypothetical protein
VQPDLRNTQNSATPKYLLVGNVSLFSLLENDQNSSIKTCSNQLNYFATTNPHGWQAPSEFKPIIIIITISTIFFILILLLLVVVVVVVFLLLLLAVAIFSHNNFNVCGAVIGFYFQVLLTSRLQQQNQKSSNQRKPNFTTFTSDNSSIKSLLL